MPENSWRESDSYSDPLSSLLPDLPDLAELSDSLAAEELAEVTLDTPFNRGMVGRRRKAALALTAVWGSTILLHLSSWGTAVVLGLTTLVGLHIVRMLCARPIAVPPPLMSDDLADYPHISVLVAAKNEEAVITSLVTDLCNLDYPSSCYDLWIIDDSSTDRTPQLLDQLTEQYQQLHVVHRPVNSGGGKSGALNTVWTQAKGDLIAVFDADAKVPKDLLRRVVPLFDRAEVGAVQVQKALSNASRNLWTQGQVAEMALDSYLQQQRLAIGGLGELRGNGQFVRRRALESFGGWNEQTITDDLDLTLRLHLNQWDIDFLLLPAVAEEGVTNAIGLWHQRNRWAEGGYQRYLDYWRLIGRNRMGTVKTADLLVFWLTQYILPTATVPDAVMAIIRNCPPLFFPLTSITLLFSLIGMWVGLQRTMGDRPRRRFPRYGLQRLVHVSFGIVYMLHWLPVLASTTARMAVRPKRLKWVKTIHHGAALSGSNRTAS